MCRRDKRIELVYDLLIVVSILFRHGADASLFYAESKEIIVQVVLYVYADSF